MKKTIKNAFVVTCLFTTLSFSIIVPLAKTEYPTYNDVWTYGTEKVVGTKYTYSDYLNFNNVNWYTASITDKKNILKARAKQTDGSTHAHARSVKKSGNQVFYNFK